MDIRKDDCLAYGNVLDDDLSGIDRTMNAVTEKACGQAACTCVLTFIGLGEERKPFLTDAQGMCLEDMPASSGN